MIDGEVSRQEIRSSANGTIKLLGFAMIQDTSTILTTDTNFGAVVIEIEMSGEAKTVLRTNIPGQVASCAGS